MNEFHLQENVRVSGDLVVQRTRLCRRRSASMEQAADTAEPAAVDQ